MSGKDNRANIDTEEQQLNTSCETSSSSTPEAPSQPPITVGGPQGALGEKSCFSDKTDTTYEEFTCGHWHYLANCEREGARCSNCDQTHGHGYSASHRTHGVKPKYG